jgi:hypothetical protein
MQTEFKQMHSSHFGMKLERWGGRKAEGSPGSQMPSWGPCAEKWQRTYSLSHAQNIKLFGPSGI